MEHPGTRIDQELCTGCGLCAQACGRKIIVLEHGKARVAAPDRCVFCGHCRAVCPVEAPLLSEVDSADFLPIPPAAQHPTPEQTMLLLRARRSIRFFRERAVEDDKLALLLEAARHAPTGQNRQALGYVVLRRASALDEVRELTVRSLLEQADRLERARREELQGGAPLNPADRAWQDYPPLWRMLAKLHREGLDPLFHHAPAVIVCHVHPELAIHPEVEAGMAAMHMALMAHSLGLGTCFCGLLDYAADKSAELSSFMGLPPGHLVPISFMLGYPRLRYQRLVARRPVRANWL